MSVSSPSSLTASPGVNWYALYAKHNHERKVAELLGRKGVEVFLPEYRSVRTWKDRKKTLSMPLFPGYVFLRSALQDKVEILSTPGVFFIVEIAGHACPIPEYEIDAIRTITSGDVPYEPHPFIDTGELVRICSGSLAGLIGIFVKPKNKHRVVVSVELLQKSVSIEVDAGNVERIGRLPNQQKIRALAAGAGV